MSNDAKKGSNFNIATTHNGLGAAVKMWPTPRAGKTTDENEGVWQKRKDRGGVSTPPLSLAVKMWPTPTKSDGTGGPGCSGREGGDNLRTAIKVYPTPAARDYKGANSKEHCEVTGSGRKHMDQLPNAIAHGGGGAGGSLSPDWVEFLVSAAAV
jgi:hypothetical protein